MQAPDDLRTVVQDFARAFGFLRTAQTPCGKPLPLSHAHALMVLHARGAERTLQRDLGRILGIDKSNVARLCARMEKLGHLKQTRCDEDGRARIVRLTAKGARVAEDVDGASRDRFARVFRSLPERDRPRVIAAVRTLVTAIDTLEPSA